MLNSRVGFPSLLRIFIAVFTCYALLGILDLAYIPIPWLDEAANLEPAVLWQRTGHLISKGWPNPGADAQFLSYLPAIHVLHRLTLSILPCEVFYIRLPFLLIHLSTIFLLFIVLHKQLKIGMLAAVILTCFYMFDKTVFEISRALRSETIEAFLLVLLFYIYFSKKQFLLLGIIAGTLLLTHLKEWPAIAIFSGIFIFSSEGSRNKIGYLSGVFILPFIYLVFIDFNLGNWYSQMFLQSTEHAAHGSVIHRVYQFFVGRFIPVYKEQPWMIGVHLFLVFESIRQSVSSKFKNIPAAIFLGSSLVSLFILGPFYRYWPPFYLVGILMLAIRIKEWNYSFQHFKKWYFIPIWIGLLFPFITRHFLAWTQRSSRDPQKAIAFIGQHIDSKKKNLVFGAEIGLYFTASTQNSDYSTEIYPDHFKYDEYEKVYFLTDKKLNLECKGTYNPPVFHLPNVLNKLGRGGTFEGMNIYLVKNKSEWDRIAIPFFKSNTL